MATLTQQEDAAAIEGIPASRSTCTVGALSAGMYLNASQEAVVGRPAISMLSFTPKGMPCSGPLDAGCRLSSTLQCNRELLVPEIHRVQLCTGLANHFHWLRSLTSNVLGLLTAKVLDLTYVSCKNGSVACHCRFKL